MALLSTAFLAACAEPGGLDVSGPAPVPTAAAVRSVQVCEGPGRPPLRRPAVLDIAGAVRLTGLRWASWGGPVAEATGDVAAGRGRPLRARVRLDGLVEHEHRAYYGRASVTADGLPAARRAGLSDLRLFVPKRQR
ncbi:hypothetical protein AC230_00755 [Streptomyces caatingaensis]|uniref:Uncharacterized protein n=1 Tax=Streptomyces caatingaensis TaxID=1678637 RepID=A0A0K9XMV4_9ACTN|nr:hypothetical protein AC230_00755 [Streptomyces caatingaensis]